MNSNFDPDRADQLLASLLQMKEGGGARVPVGEVTNELLDEFFDGYPLDNLRLLLRSRDHTVVAAGAFIASELSFEALPLLDDIVDLLHHPYAPVRFGALDFLLGCVGSKDTESVLKALELLEDADSRVRFMAMNFASKLPEDVLRAVKDTASVQYPITSHAKGLELVLNSLDLHGTDAITSGLTDTDAVLRRYAAVAAIRLAHRDPTPLRKALNSEDATIKSLAEHTVSSLSD